MTALIMGGAAFAYTYARRSRAPDVEALRLTGYRALQLRGRDKVYLYAPADHVRARVRCAAGVALEVCGGKLELAGRPAESSTVRGDGVLLDFGPLEHDAELAGQRLERSTPLAAVEATDDEARASALEARIAASDTPPLDVLDAMKERARIYTRQGRVDKYRELQESRADRALHFGFPTEASDAWSASAYFAHRARDFDAMERLLDRAERLDESESFELGLVRARLVRGYAEVELGRYRAALVTLEDAAKIAWLYGHDADHAWVEKALGPLYLELGLPDKALAELHRLAPYFEGQDERSRLAFLVDLAWVELEAMARSSIPRQIEVPVRRFEDALVLARRLNSQEDEANILINLLWADYLVRDPARARLRSLELAKLPGQALSFSRQFAAIVEATFAMEAGDNTKAVELFDNVLVQSEQEQHGAPSPYVWRARYGLARAYWQRGDIEHARREFHAAQDALETLALQADLQSARARFFADAASLRDDAVRFFLQHGPVEDAFLASERARTHVLLSLELQVRSERLAQTERLAVSGQRQTYLALRTKLESRAGERRGVASSSLAAFDVETEELAARARRELSALYAALDKEAPVMTGRLATVGALWEVLPEDAELITFARAGSSTVTFSVRRGRVEAHELGAGPLSAASFAKGTRHIYFVAGGPYSVERLAKEVLPLALQDHTASVLPYAGALLRPRSQAKGRALIVADPNNDLPHARREGAGVAKTLSGATLLDGELATESAVKDALRGASSFHFAGHGELGADDPWKSRLELSDGALTLESLLVTAPGVRNVVLSGCETGRGGSLSRDLAIGLPEIFAMAGADTVLATTAKVEDADAARFIELFYSEGGAENPARAFRTAALATRDNSFYLMGRGE